MSEDATLPMRSGMVIVAGGPSSRLLTPTLCLAPHLGAGEAIA
jgi:hypothetical protein